MRRSQILTLISIVLICLLSFLVILIQTTYFPFGGNLFQGGNNGRVSTTTGAVTLTQTGQVTSVVGIQGPNQAQITVNPGVTETIVQTLTEVVSSGQTITTVTTHTNVINLEQILPAPEFPLGSLVAILVSVLALLCLFVVRRNPQKSSG